jgi:hypothetical protein
MRSLSSSAHSRDPLASPNTRGAASGSTALIQSTPEAISAAMRAFRAANKQQIAPLPK